MKKFQCAYGTNYKILKKTANLCYSKISRFFTEADKMKKTIISLIIMIVSSCVGLFVGGQLNNDIVGGMILFALISGIACVIHTIENK